MRPNAQGPPMPVALHFRVAKEPRHFRWPRVLCGLRPKRGVPVWRWDETRELRADAVVACPTCMVIKDLWLLSGHRHPLTIRRARAFLKANGFPHP